MSANNLKDQRAKPSGGSLQLNAIKYLRRSFEINPPDPRTVYCLAFAYLELGDIEQAQKHFQKVLKMQAPEDLRGLAGNRLREIAVRGLKARGTRLDRSSTRLGPATLPGPGPCRRSPDPVPIEIEFPRRITLQDGPCLSL